MPLSYNFFNLRYDMIEYIFRECQFNSSSQVQYLGHDKSNCRIFLNTYLYINLNKTLRVYFLYTTFGLYKWKYVVTTLHHTIKFHQRKGIDGPLCSLLLPFDSQCLTYGQFRTWKKKWLKCGDIRSYNSISQPTNHTYSESYFINK